MSSKENRLEKIMILKRTYILFNENDFLYFSFISLQTVTRLTFNGSKIRHSQLAIWPSIPSDRCCEGGFIYESLTINSTGTFSTSRRSGDGRYTGRGFAVFL